MAKTFDATLNNLIGDHVADWAAFLVARVRLPARPVEVLYSRLAAAPSGMVPSVNNGFPYGYKPSLWWVSGVRQVGSAVLARGFLLDSEQQLTTDLFRQRSQKVIRGETLQTLQ